MTTTSRRRRRARRFGFALILFAVLLSLWGTAKLGWYGALPDRESRQEPRGELVDPSAELAGLGSDVDSAGGSAGMIDIGPSDASQQILDSNAGSGDSARSDDRVAAADESLSAREPASPEGLLAENAAEVVEPEPGLSEAARLDLRHGLSMRVREAVQSAQFVQAFRELDQLAELDAGDGTKLGAEVDSAVRARVEVARIDLGAGRVLQASDHVRILMPVLDRVGEALNALIEDGAGPVDGVGASLSPSLFGGPAPVAVGIDRPRPLQPGMSIRARHKHRVLKARLAGATGARPDEVTVKLRLPEASGLLYPSIQRAAIEPVSGSEALAADQCRAGIHAGDRVLALLWWLRARSLGASSATLDGLYQALVYKDG